VLAS